LKSKNQTGTVLDVNGTEKQKLSALQQLLAHALAVFVMSVVEVHGQAHPHCELKTRPRFCPVSLSLSM